ncbi:MAG: TetR/AcrR family transcriptional regulator [Dyella sp.]
MSAIHRGNASDTRQRLLDAAELLFIERGYNQMSLRLITARADANLAAVNYHYGSKETLIHDMLSRRLVRLNQERLALLDAYQQQSANPLSCQILLTILFAPALRIGRDPTLGGPDFMRLLGRVYSDSSGSVGAYLQEHYQPIFDRFFAAFAQTLPHVSRSELGLRLHFALKAISGLLAGSDLTQLIDALSMGESLDEAEILGRLVSLLAATITAPFANTHEIAQIALVLDAAQATAAAANRRRGAEKPAHLTSPATAMRWQHPAPAHSLPHKR